jgi:uncharacterized protein (TIGR03084 family)
MEAWAHGQDIVDTVGAVREPTDRLRHIAQLGFITRGWTYMNRGLDVPSTPVRVELESPRARRGRSDPTPAPIRPSSRSSAPRSTSAWSPPSAATSDDTALVVTGASARDWMEKAQLFAGPPSDGPRPR